MYGACSDERARVPALPVTHNRERGTYSLSCRRRAMMYGACSDERARVPALPVTHDRERGTYK